MNLVSRIQCLNLSGWGFQSSVLFSDPKTALPLPELKCGEKGREQRKAVAWKRWINGKNRCVGTWREGSPRWGNVVMLMCFPCLFLPGIFMHYAPQWHEEHAIFFPNPKKLLHHSDLKSLPIGEENTLPKFTSTACFKILKIERFSNDPTTPNTLSKIFYIGLVAYLGCVLWYVQIKPFHTTFLKLISVNRKFINNKLALLSWLLNRH